MWSLKTLLIHYYIMEIIIIQLDHQFSVGRTVYYISSTFSAVLGRVLSTFIAGLVSTCNLGRVWSQVRHWSGSSWICPGTKLGPLCGSVSPSYAVKLCYPKPPGCQRHWEEQ